MHKDKVVTEEAVTKAIQELMGEGWRLDEIKNETLRGRLGGGSNRDISLLFFEYRKRLTKETVLKTAQQANADSIFANASKQVIATMRELHIAGLAGFAEQNEKLAKMAAEAQEGREIARKENEELQTLLSKLQEENQGLRSADKAKNDRMKLLEDANARLSAENQGLVRDVQASLDKLLAASAPKPKPVPKKPALKTASQAS